MCKLALQASCSRADCRDAHSQEELQEGIKAARASTVSAQAQAAGAHNQPWVGGPPMAVGPASGWNRAAPPPA